MTNNTFKFDSDFVIYLTAVLEYIKIEHLLKAVNDNEELKSIFDRLGISFVQNSEHIRIDYPFLELTIRKVGTVNEYDDELINQNLPNNEKEELDLSIQELKQLMKI
jgi:hypothetical protein